MAGSGVAELERRAERMRREFVALLAEAGVFPDPAWRDAFARVPRHIFVPAYYDPAGPLLSRDDPARRDRWLAGVHSDQALVTERTGREPTSASSQPSLMASMLHDLRVTDGCRVLEIGTGTGYNAALLAHRLGDDGVISLDVSPELTRAARARLAEAGYRPRVITADGALGWPPGAPYDRIIATCRIDAVPLPWLRQLAPDGLIVAPLGLGVVRLARTGTQSGRGRFLGTAYFMPLRPGDGDPEGPEAARPLADARDLPAPAAAPAALRPRSRRTALTAPDATDPDFRFLTSLIEPGLELLQDGDLLARAGDGSTARLHADGTVTESGPRRLWTVLEETHRAFVAAERPAVERYGFSVDGRRQRLWLDEPDGPSWPLPAARTVAS